MTICGALLAGVLGFAAGRKVTSRRRRCGRRGWHGHGWRGHGRRHSRGRRLLWHLFDKLDTSPGQEKVIREEFRKLMEIVREHREEGARTRDDVARAMGGEDSESLDQAVFAEMFARHDERLSAVREAAVASLSRIHEVLDPEQRSALASLVASGRVGPWSMGGPYR